MERNTMNSNTYNNSERKMRKIKVQKRLMWIRVTFTILLCLISFLMGRSVSSVKASNITNECAYSTMEKGICLEEYLEEIEY